MTDTAHWTKQKIDMRYQANREYRYWLYDPEDGVTYYRTQEDRDAAANIAVATYLDGSWSEDVELVAAGEVTHIVQCLDKVLRPADLDEEGCDGAGDYWADEWEWTGNYTMEPLPDDYETGEN
jgi:hypothetical protein